MKQAAYWYEKAAEQCFIQAQCNLGVLYQREGRTRDYEKAIVWYKKAAEQGDAYAQRNIGLMYLQGRGVDRGRLQGYGWYIKSVYSAVKIRFKFLRRKGN